MKKSFCLFLAFAVLLLVGCSRDFSATLFYTTDTHGRLDSDGDSIGMGRIAALKKDTPASLIVDAGDFLQGNPSVNLTQGKDAVRVMKMVGYYAAALGNHEFDFGQEALQARIAEAAAEPNPLYFISANVLYENGTAFVPPAVTTTVNGLKIGFFGLTTEETAVQTHPRNIQGIVFADVLQSAGPAAAKLRAEGCDAVVALTHVGTEGVTGITSRDIAAQVKGIDVVIDGHSHAELHETLPNGTLLVSSGAHANALGRLTLVRKGSSDSPLEKSAVLLRKEDMAGITPDPPTIAILAGIKEEQSLLLGRVVGESPMELDAERVNIRSRETNFGNLCADALRYMTGADIAVINGGGIRRSIAKGKITKGDIAAAIPFADAVVSKEVTGAQIMEILEHGFHGLPAENGAFPQISGLRVKVDPAKPAGKRVVTAVLHSGKQLDPQRKYTIAVTDFLAAGGDGYPVLAKLPVFKLHMPPVAALEIYLKDLGPKAFDSIMTGRITMLRGQTLSLRPVWLPCPGKVDRAA